MNYVSSDVCISNFLYDLLGVSCLAQKLIGPDFFKSGGIYCVPRKLLPLVCPSMGHHHLHVFLVDYMYVKHPLVLDVLSLWLRLPMDYLGNQVYF